MYSQDNMEKIGVSEENSISSYGGVVSRIMVPKDVKS